MESLKENLYKRKKILKDFYDNETLDKFLDNCIKDVEKAITDWKKYYLITLSTPLYKTTKFEYFKLKYSIKRTDHEDQVFDKIFGDWEE